MGPLLFGDLPFFWLLRSIWWLDHGPEGETGGFRSVVRSVLIFFCALLLMLILLLFRVAEEMKAVAVRLCWLLLQAVLERTGQD